MRRSSARRTARASSPLPAMSTRSRSLARAMAALDDRAHERAAERSTKTIAQTMKIASVARE